MNMQFDDQDRLVWPDRSGDVLAMLRAASDVWVEVLSNAPLPVEADDATFLLALQRRNLAGLELGRRIGWWSGQSASGPDTPPQIVSAGAFEGKTMAHVMAEIGFFKSVGDARRNGWDKPITIGVFKVGKNKVVDIRP